MNPNTIEKIAEKWFKVIENEIYDDQIAPARSSLKEAISEATAELRKELDNLRLANQQIEKDKERLDWLTDFVGDTRQASDTTCEIYQDDATHDYFVGDKNNKWFGTYFRRAIDAAMKGTK